VPCTFGTGSRAAAAILVGALVLRLVGLDRKSIWFDEAITHLDAHVPWSELLESLRADVHPPLSYALYHLWPGVDGGDFWLRLPSAVLGAVGAAVAWAWARRIGSPRQAALTGLFVAVAPLQIDLAQEARMYGLLLLLSALSLWLLDVLLTTPSRAAWLGYAATASLMLYTHYYAAFLLLAQGLSAVLAGRVGVRWALTALVLAGLTFVPWLPVLVEQASSISGDYWIEAPRLSTLWVTFRELAAHTPPDEPFRLMLRVGYLVQAVLLGLGAAPAVRLPRQRAAVLFGVVPLALALGISVLIAPVFAVRYISPLGLAFGFLLARGITALPRLYAVLAAGVAFVPVVLSLGPLYLDPGYGSADLRSAAHAVQAARQPQDVVLHLGAFSGTPFDYYGVAQPARVLETNERTELCQALRPASRGWLVTAYAPDDGEARALAEAGITAPAYAGALVEEPPLRFLGVSVFHLTRECADLSVQQ
jgi:hypothetical protein